jgi:hypothetical protein
VVGAVDTCRLENDSCLVLGELQVVRAELDVPAFAAQAAEGKHEPRSGRDAEPRRKAGGERADEVHRPYGLQLVGVVEHQYSRSRPAPQ